MDHEGPVKFAIGSWTHPRTTSIYIKEKKLKVIIEFEPSKRHILRPTLSTDMVQGGAAYVHLITFDVTLMFPSRWQVRCVACSSWPHMISPMRMNDTCVCFLWLMCMVIQVNERARAEAQFGVWSLNGHLYLSGVCTRVDGSIFANLSNFA